jgi:hypothetical protein
MHRVYVQVSLVHGHSVHIRWHSAVLRQHVEHSATAYSCVCVRRGAGLSGELSPLPLAWHAEHRLEHVVLHLILVPQPPVA